MRLARGLLLATVAASVGLAGCSSKVKLREPAKLVRIEQPTVEPKSAWSRGVGNGSGGVVSGLRLVLESDGLFTAAANGDVVAIDPKTGSTIWSARTKARVISGPTVSGDKLYVGTLDGELIALARADGKERWRTQFSAEIIAPVAVSGDLVVVRTVDGREFGLSSGDGSKIWNFDRNEPNLTLRGMSPPLIVANRVFTGLDSGKIAALSLADGAPVWEQSISVPSGRSELERLVDIDANLLSSNLGLLVVTYGNDIALLDMNTGDSRWRRSIKSYSGLAADSARVYVTDDDGLMWALDPESGAAVWKQDQLKFRRLSAPGTLGEDYVVAGDFEGWLHWFKSREGSIAGRLRHSHQPITAAPVSDGQRLFVMDVKGNLTAYEIAPAR